MVQGRYKSRTLRRVFVKTPKRTKISYKKRKPSKPKCSICKKVLQGMLRERPYKMRNIAKTKKRPERPFAGVLCSQCLRKKILEENIRK